MYICGGWGREVHMAQMHMWRSEDNSVKLVHSFHLYMGPDLRTQLRLGLGIKHLHLLSHLTSHK